MSAEVFAKCKPVGADEGARLSALARSLCGTPKKLLETSRRESTTSKSFDLDHRSFIKKIKQQDTGQKKNADAARAAEAPLRRRTDNRGLQLVIDCERY